MAPHRDAQKLLEAIGEALHPYGCTVSPLAQDDTCSVMRGGVEFAWLGVESAWENPDAFHPDAFWAETPRYSKVEFYTYTSAGIAMFVRKVIDNL